MSPRSAPFSIWLSVLVALLPAAAAFAEADYDLPPIDYSSGAVDDAVARLAARLARGEVALAWDQRHGYLPAVLKALDVPVSSQLLVFSKTSLQRDAITPSTPRALYFNDEVYVGTVHGGQVVELAAVDRRQGTVFYVLGQQRQDAPAPRRQTHECLQCHDSSTFTGGVPGLMMRSVYTDGAGQPVLSAGSFLTDQRSRWDDRWGGWYVTGSHGAMRHLGNQVVDENVRPESFDREPGANLIDLARRIDTASYLAPGSDVVALMVLGHQTQMHNLITRAGFEARRSQQYDAELNRALDRPAGFQSQTTALRIRSAGEALLRYLLFSHEAALTATVTGTSDFAREFTARGPRDGRGRSLRDLDLERRLLRHPCSHLIYSPAFDALPPPMLGYVLDRLLAVLTGADRSPDFAHLDDGERRAILEILVATKAGLPPAFAAALK